MQGIIALFLTLAMFSGIVYYFRYDVTPLVLRPLETEILLGENYQEAGVIKSVDLTEFLEE